MRLPKPNLPLDFSSQTYFSHELSVFFSVRGNFSWDTVVLHIFRKYCWDRPSTIMQCLCRKRKLRRRQFPHHCLRVVLKIDKRIYIVSQDAILYKKFPMSNINVHVNCERVELLEFRSIPLNVTELTITDWIFQIPLSLIALTLFFFLKKHICAKPVFSIKIYISIQSVSESFTLACWDKSLSHSLKPENVTCIFFNLILKRMIV